MCQGILIKNIQLVIWNQKALNEPRVYGLRKYTTTTKEFEKNIQQKFHPAGSAMFSNETFVEVFRWVNLLFVATFYSIYFS
jgi:hypothetical protein